MYQRYTPNSTAPSAAHPLQRIRWWYAVLIVVGAIFVIRLFYLQVLKHDYYQRSAYKSQLKQYEIPAERGTISAHDGGAVVPLVLNETLYTLYADPAYVKDAEHVAIELQKVIGGDASALKTKITTPDMRYVVLGKKLSKEQKEAVDSLKLKGVGTQESPYRTYPDGQLASQTLGFVNEEGQGKYGLEEALDSELAGKPGMLRAITDASGVPLAANKDNRITDPVKGNGVVLTLDIGVQQQVEDILKAFVDKTQAKSGSVVVMEANSGAVTAMANYPTYDPSKYSEVQDGALFNNDAVSAPLEVGSIMKTLTAAAAMNEGLVNRNTTYYDPSYFKIDGATVKNVEEDGGAGTRSMEDLLRLSLNTGATWLLMQMGGGEINAKARNTWHGYMVDHYRFGKNTGIEQGYESSGSVPDPNEGFGLNITYANTAFGQALSVTPLQMAAAFAAMLNGGTYYQPHLVDGTVAADGTVTPKQPVVVASDIVKDGVSQDMRSLLETVFRRNRAIYTDKSFSSAYSVGGKTGTAQISKPEGGYYDDRFNGTYLGFVGGDTVQYVIAVRVSEPKIAGYAGSKAAAPVYGDIANVLINNYGVTPRSQ